MFYQNFSPLTIVIEKVENISNDSDIVISIDDTKVKTISRSSYFSVKCVQCFVYKKVLFGK